MRLAKAERIFPKMNVLRSTTSPHILACVLLIWTTIAGAESLVLRGANVARFVDDSLQFETMDVFIEDGRIVELTATGQLGQAESRRVDVAGLYLMPGLIDLHTHIVSNFQSVDDVDAHYILQLNEPLDSRRQGAIAAAKTTLQAGFTTIRDVSTEGAGSLDVALAKAIEEGRIVGPRIVPSTLGIAATNGYLPFSADGRSKPQGAQTADTTAELQNAVRQQQANGARWIKVFADFPPDQDSRSIPMFSLQQLEAVVKEAGRLGLGVAAHAVGDEAALNCIEAGVDTIEHGFALSEETMLLMVKEEVVLVPTLNALVPDDGLGADTQWVGSLAERIRRSGVVIGLGSDAGSAVAHGSNFAEVFALVELGFPAEDVLRAATVVGADVLGRSNELGQIEVGYIADIVAYQNSPLDDIETLSKPVLVVKEGMIVFDGRNGN